MARRDRRGPGLRADRAARARPRGWDPAAHGAGGGGSPRPPRGAHGRAGHTGSACRKRAPVVVAASAGSDCAGRPAAGRSRGGRGRGGRRPLQASDGRSDHRRTAAGHPQGGARALPRGERAPSRVGRWRRYVGAGASGAGAARHDPCSGEVAPNRRRLDQRRDLRRQRWAGGGVRDRGRCLGSDRRLELRPDRRRGGGSRFCAVDGDRRVSSPKLV